MMWKGPPWKRIRGAKWREHVLNPCGTDDDKENEKSGFGDMLL